MKIISASKGVRASIHAIVVGQMASALIAAKTDLLNRSACREALIETGFGDQSVTHLLNRAIEAARISVAATEEH